MHKGMNQTAALLSSMLPYDTLGLYEQTKPSLMYRVPRVVPDQKSRFESDELFRRLSRESEVNINSPPIQYSIGDAVSGGGYQSAIYQLPMAVFS